MIEVPEQLYIVKTQGSSWGNSGSDKWIWFRVAEGEKQGTSIRIPLHEYPLSSEMREEFSPELQKQLSSLSDGEVVKAKLHRAGPEALWIPKTLEKQE
jgi:hypothetical protein